MPKKKEVKNNKGKNSTKAIKKIENNKTKETKKVEVKPIVKEKKKKEKKGNGKFKAFINKIVNKISSDMPFAVALCIILLLVGALLLTFSIRRVPSIKDNNKVLATVDGKNITSKDLNDILIEKYGEDAKINLLENGSYVIATVNGKSFTTNDLYAALKENYGTDVLMDLIDTYIAEKEVKITDEDKKYVQEVVDYYKQYAEYYNTDLATFLANYVGLNGISTEKEFSNFVLEDYKKTLAVQKFIGDQASEDDLKEYYKENYSDKLTVKHILIEVDSEAEDKDAADEEAYNKAVKLISKLDKTDSKKLDSKFEELAKNNSDDTETYSNGGLIEDFSKKDVVEEFYNAAADLKDGEYTKEPVKTTYGYHIILKVSSTPVEKYKDIKEEVRTAYAKSLLSNDNNLRITKWDELRNQYKLSIKDDFINSTYKKTIKDATNAEKSDTKKTED